MEIIIAVIIAIFAFYLLFRSLRKSSKGGCSCSEKKCSSCPSKSKITFKK